MNDLHRLTHAEDNYMRSRATMALGSGYFYIPNKQQAWNDLHRLTFDESSNVRYSAVEALGSVFSQIPDKQQAWNDLHRLTDDEDHYVRTSSNHSLGKISIFKASQAETDEDYKKELEKAIEFFEIAAKESPLFDPAQFCLPFYRSFHTIIFKKQEAKEEVNKYLEEAKAAVEGSKSKELLFEAVINLAKALEEVQKLGDIDLQAMKGELNLYRKYCEKAAELMRNTDDKAPYATRVLRKGLPILDRNLKELIKEIQKKAKIACKESIGTEAQEIVCGIYNEIQSVTVDYQLQYIETTKVLEDILSIVKMKIPQIPENKFILSKIEAVDKKQSADKYQELPFIISLIPNNVVVPAQELNHIHHKVDYISDKTDFIYDKTISIDAKLDNIRFAIFRIKLNSYNAFRCLDEMKTELEKLDEVVNLNNSFEELIATQSGELNELKVEIQHRLDDIDDLISKLLKNDDQQKVNLSNELNKLKKELKSDEWLQRLAAFATFFSLLLSVFPQ